MKKVYPILEFDPDRAALIEPGDGYEAADLPEACVVCFFQDEIEKLHGEGQAHVITHLVNEIGQFPVFVVEARGWRFALFHPGVGAPLAAACLEEVIALGCRKFMVCGGAGVLHPDLALGHPIVVSGAVRDEGTSYHYLPPGREVAAHPAGVAALERALRRRDIPYVVGKTWTTDAFYRETRQKIRLRREEGCIAVEMEAAALFAVAEFRGVLLGQILYAGDDVSGRERNHREWNLHVDARESVFWIAAEACAEL